MSRICVKHLPLKDTKDDICKKFPEKGQVTDVKIILTPCSDGKSRQFGFIGYGTPQEAAEAIKYFHDTTFMGAYKISCEIAPTPPRIGELNIPRAWSRH